MPTNTPPDPKTQPEQREKPAAQPRALPPRGDSGADQDARPPEREKRIERFRER